MDLNSIANGLITNVVWLIVLFLIRSAFNPVEHIPRRRGFSKRVIVRQFYICLLIFAVSVYVFASTEFTSEFSLSGVLKSFSLIFGTLSYLLLVAAFDAGFEYKGPEEKLVHRQRDQSGDDFPGRN